MDPPRIFISYRRDDAAGYARAVGDELARRFGESQVFVDVDDIAAGQAFDETIERALGASTVLLVLIGRRWLGEREGRPPRIADADDFVHREVASGLGRELRIIPLLLDGAAMPAETLLPEALRPLARRNAIEIGNTSFKADIERLVTALRETVGEPGAKRARPKLVVAGVAAALLATAAGWTVLGLQHPPRPDDGPPRLRSSTADAALDGAWQAEVSYDWPNAHYVERFVFSTRSGELHGSASFLRVPRGLLEGRIENDGLSFVTHSGESTGDASVPVVHRYRARRDGDTLRFVMQTEGGSSAHVPVEFVARREAGAAASAAR